MGSFEPSGIYTLTRDPFFQIYHLLEEKEFFAVRQTCRLIRNSVQDYVRDCLEKIVSAHNSALSRSENIATIAKRVFLLDFDSNANKPHLLYKKIQNIVFSALSVFIEYGIDPDSPLFLEATSQPYHFYFTYRKHIEKCLASEADDFFNALLGNDGPFSGLTDFVGTTPLLEHFDQNWNIIDLPLFLIDVKKHIQQSILLFRTLYPEKMKEFWACCANDYELHFLACTKFDKIKKDCEVKIQQILKGSTITSLDIQFFQGAIFFQTVDSSYYPQIAKIALDQTVDELIELLIKIGFVFEKKDEKNMCSAHKELYKTCQARKIQREDQKAVVKKECENIEYAYHRTFNTVLLPSMTKTYYQDPLFILWEMKTKRKIGIAIYKELASEIYAQAISKKRTHESETLFFCIREIKKKMSKKDLENKIKAYIEKNILTKEDLALDRFAFYKIQALFKLAIPKTSYDKLYEICKEEPFIDMGFYLTDLKARA